MKKSKFGFYESENHQLSKNVHYLRTKARMSRITFSEKMNMSNNLLFCLEKRFLRAITEEAMQTICDYYNITPEELFYTDLREVQAKRIRRK